jgi:hypothetical protein
LFYTFTSTACIGRCHRRCRRHACQSTDAPAETGKCKGRIVCKPNKIVFFVIIVVIVIVIAGREQNSWQGGDSRGAGQPRQRGQSQRPPHSLDQPLALHTNDNTKDKWAK